MEEPARCEVAGWKKINRENREPTDQRQNKRKMYDEQKHDARHGIKPKRPIGYRHRNSPPKHFPLTRIACDRTIHHPFIHSPVHFQSTMLRLYSFSLAYVYVTSCSLVHIRLPGTGLAM